jgi:hypothetical protein
MELYLQYTSSLRSVELSTGKALPLAIPTEVCVCIFEDWVKNCLDGCNLQWHAVHTEFHENWPINMCNIDVIFKFFFSFYIVCQRN